VDASFTLLSSVAIERRRESDRAQLALFDTTTAPEPGEARVVLAPLVRENVAARHVVTLAVARYLALGSAVARRLYRLLEVARAQGHLAWRVSLEDLKELLPLVQRYPSHLQRVLQPAHDALVEVGVLRSATVRQHRRAWHVDYVLGHRDAGPVGGAGQGASAQAGGTAPPAT
jgi:hypothetical protein